MLTQLIYDAYTKISPLAKSRITSFLAANQGADVNQNQIQTAIEYAVKERPSFGGFILSVEKENTIVGALVVNQTGMEGYSPKHILVSYGIDESVSNTNVGRDLLQKAIKFANGDIGLHIAPDNPAVQLFKSLGFTAEYLDMRFSNNAKKNIA